MKLSLILDVIARGEQRLRKMTGDVRDLSVKGVRPLARATDSVDQANRRVSASTFRYTRLALRSADAFDRATAAAGRFAGRAGLRGVELAARGVRSTLQFTIAKAWQFSKALAGWGALGAGAAGGWLVGGTLKVASDFEQMQVALEGTEGSAEKAKNAMAWVAKFAKDTPYEIAQVTDAFVRARGVGIDPMTGAMTKLGDAAGGSRKTLMEAVEALADAQTGEFERLKEFNITTSVKGDNVTFSYIDKAGKNAEKSVKKNMASIRDSVLSIFDEKYGGGMLRQSRTLAGIWSNIKDSLVSFQLKVANGGFFDKVKGQLQGVLDRINKMDEDGSLAKWAEQTSDWLSKAVDQAVKFARETDWSEVGKNLWAVGKAIWWVVELLGKAVRLSADFVNNVRWAANTRTSDWLGVTTPPPPKARPGAPVTTRDWQKGLQAGKPALRAPATGAGAAAPSGKVQVDVKLSGDGARGARATVKSSSPNVPATVWTTSSKRGPAMGGGGA